MPSEEPHQEVLQAVASRLRLSRSSKWLPNLQRMAVKMTCGGEVLHTPHAAGWMGRSLLCGLLSGPIPSRAGSLDAV